MDEVNIIREVIHTPDSEERVKKLLEYANRGSQNCQELVARGYYEGLPYFEKNEELADFYFRKAADQGESYSQYMVWYIAANHNKQLYDEKSYEFQNLIKSADNEYPYAMFILSSCYINGKLKAGDYAHLWHIERNKEKAEYYLDKLDKWLTEHDDVSLKRGAENLREQLDEWDFNYKGGSDSDNSGKKRIYLIVVITICVIYLIIKFF